MPAWPRRLHGSVWPVRYCPAYPQPPQQLGWPEPFPGQHFPHHPVCGLVRGIFFPPSLLHSQISSAQQAQGHVVCQPAQVRVSYSSRPTSFFSVSNSVSIRQREPVCQGLQRGILRSIGQVVAGFAAVPVPPVDGPVDFAGLAPAGRSHPLERSKGQLRGPWLPSATVISRQASSGNSSLRCSMGPSRNRVCGDARIPDTPHWSRQAPAATL